MKAKYALFDSIDIILMVDLKSILLFKINIPENLQIDSFENHIAEADQSVLISD